MSWEQRSADFCNAQTDAHMAYIEAEREADRLQTENDKLRELVRDAIQAMWACDNDVCVHRCECDEGIEYPRQMDCLIERRARELGIEVLGK